MAALIESRARGQADAKRDRAERMRAWEQSQLRLIAEFPDQPLAYEGLLCVAQQHPDAEQAARIAGQLIATTATPNWVARKAQELLDRQKLLGKALESVLPEALRGESDGPISVGAPIVIYAWSLDRSDSLMIADRFAAAAPEGAKMFGICLDTDVDLARQVARQANLPGQQVFDDGGPLGLVAQRLMISEVSTAYLVGADGTIRSVTYHHTLLRR
ncbi:MAG: hypothetical protein HC834_00950 [Rhodospirillales bacterium]|nr:hypothetical protein [Rhodospirillales bacterium]